MRVRVLEQGGRGDLVCVSVVKSNHHDKSFENCGDEGEGS